MKYACDVCGWMYDESDGMLELEIEPGTPFEDIPEFFECPECYADKSHFSEYEE